MDFYIDIETIPSQKEGEVQKIMETIKPPGNYKKPETIEKWMKENALAEATEKWQKTALNGAHGEMVSIAFAFGDEPVVCVHRELGKSSEKHLLEEFLSFVERVNNPTWVGHNVEWDMRFLWQRCLINGLPSASIIPVDRRDRFFCTMKTWAGYRDTISLDNLAKAFGVEGKIDSGSNVWDMVKLGDYKRLVEYNISDVEITRQIHQRMTMREAA